MKQRRERRGYLVSDIPALKVAVAAKDAAAVSLGKARKGIRARKNPSKRLEMDCKRHGLSVVEWCILAMMQNGCCAVCKRALILGGKKSGTTPGIDHDHKTGKIRGILCNSCNVALGFLRDSVENLKNAIKYLDKSTYDQYLNDEHLRNLAVRIHTGS